MARKGSENSPYPLPETGFYYHYKRPANCSDVGADAYEVLGIGKSTEKSAFSVVIRSVYPNIDETMPEDFLLCPLDIFSGLVSVENGRARRFIKITDEKIVRSLSAIRDRVYAKTSSRGVG